MRYDTHRIIEKSCGTHTLGAIDDLVGEDKVAWPDLFTQRPDSRKCDNGFDAKGFQGGNVCPCWDGGGREGMSCTMSCDEREVHTGGKACDCDG